MLRYESTEVDRRTWLQLTFSTNRSTVKSTTFVFPVNIIMIKSDIKQSNNDEYKTHQCKACENALVRWT